MTIDEKYKELSKMEYKMYDRVRQSPHFSRKTKEYLEAVIKKCSPRIDYDNGKFEILDDEGDLDWKLRTLKDLNDHHEAIAKAVVKGEFWLEESKKRLKENQLKHGTKKKFGLF
jgi:hypothetical protein